jgi:DDE family transposase
VPEKIITLYCFFDELLKALGYRDDPQAKLTTAEIMTIAAVAAQFFTGNQQAALDFLSSHGYILPFSKSRFNRRLHALPEALWQFALFVLAQIHQRTNPQRVHIVDTFPVPVCRNIRIRRCRIYQEEAFRGYCASKKEYFFGLKVCLIVTESGEPVEMLLSPGSTADITALRCMELNLPSQSTLLGDSGFLDTEFEAALREQANVNLVVPRRANMKEQLDGCLEYICRLCRKRVETTFSLLAERLARSIHAVRPRGFELKIMLTVLTFSILG